MKKHSIKNIIRFETNMFFGYPEIFRLLRKVILIERSIYIKLKNYSLLVCLLILFTQPVWAMQAPTAKAKKYKVVLDAGHGGKDPGTHGKNLNEKDVVLPVTLLVGKYLESLSDNIEVIYTRRKDVYSHPKVRAIMANDAEADLFVSIHANAMNPGYESVSGTEVFVMGTKNEGRNFEVAKRENSVILLEENYQEIYQGFDPNAPEVDIMFSIQQEAFQENSIILADNVDQQFRKRAGRKSRGVKQSSLWVLWSTSMPSVLIELGYLTNLKEEKDLGSKEVQDYLASAIFRAIRDYFEYLESTGN